MPARILVTAGVSVGNHYWIDQPVFTIGSDRDCELFLPAVGVPARAALVEFRSGSYHVRNSGRDALRIAERNVGPGETVIWESGQGLELLGGVECCLETQGDPAPTPRPAPLYLPPDPHRTASPTNSELSESVTGPPLPTTHSATSRVVQVAVILCCLPLIAVVLLRGETSDAGASDLTNEDFNGLVSAGLENNDPEMRRLVGRLQEAEAAAVRSDIELGAARYDRLWRSLAADLAPRRGGWLRERSSTSEGDTPNSSRNEFKVRLFNFTEARLAELVHEAQTER